MQFNKRFSSTRLMWILSIMLVFLGTSSSFSQDHQLWDAELSAYVDAQGNVNYNQWFKNQNGLESYLESLSEGPMQSNWSRDQKLAYWINVYNAYTIKLILDHYPLKSIMEIDNGKAWDRKWINIDGQNYSLNDVENEIIRPQFNEPRIHFAVNCAAKSCPPLANKAYTATRLEEMLEERTRSFINNETYNQLAPQMVQVSKIFDWYGVDFGDVVAFIDRYSSVSIRPNAQVGFLEYNWNLNTK